MFDKGGLVLALEIEKDLKMLALTAGEKVMVNDSRIVHLKKDSYERDAVKAIKEFVDANSLKGAQVVLNIPVSSVWVKHIMLPMMPEKEMEDAIKWQIKGEVSFDIESAIIDFELLRVVNNPDGSSSNEMVCVVASRSLVNENIPILDKAGLKISSINVSPFGYLSIFQKFELLSEDSSVALLELTESSCSLFVYSSGNLAFSRKLPWTIEKFEKTLYTLFAEEGIYESEGHPAGPEAIHGEASGDKNSASGDGSAPGAKSPENTDKPSNQVKISTDLLKQLLRRFSDDIRLSLDYYHESSDSAVSKLYISGDVKSLPGLSRYLNEHLNLEVELLSLEDKVETPEEDDNISLFGLYDLFGLALSVNKKVNLLPFEYRKRRMEDIAKIVMRVMIVLLSGFIFFSYLIINGEKVNYEKRLTAADFELNSLSGPKILNEQREALHKLKLVAEGGKVYAEEVLMIISRAILPKMFLKELSLDPGSLTGNIVGVIQTEENDGNDILLGFVRRLKKYKLIASADIGGIKSSNAGSMETIRFVIKYSIRGEKSGQQE